MKPNPRSILFFSLIALVHQHAFAADTEEVEIKREEVKPISQLTEKPLVITPTKIEITASTKLIPAAAASIKEVKSVVSEEDLKKLGLGFSFEGKKLIVTGSLSSFCAERLALDVKKEASSDLSADATLDKIDDLKEHSSRVGGRLTFSGNEKMKSLADCADLDKDEEKEDLSKNSSLSRNILSDDEIAVAGLLDSSNKVVLADESAKSDQFKKLQKQIETLDCADCINPKKNPAIFDKLGKFDSRILSALFPKVMEESLKQITDQISSAKSTRELESIRTKLLDLASQASNVKASASDKEKYLGDIAEKLGSLITRNQEIGSDAKTDTEASRNVDFIRDTYKKMAELPGIESESREEALALAKSYDKSGDGRIDYLSTIRPTHIDVKESLKKSVFTQNKLQREAQIACMGAQNQFNFTRCSDAQSKLQSFSAKTATIQQRYSASSSMSMIPGQSPWFNSPVASTANVNNLFTLNPAVFPNAAQYNQNSGLSAPQYQNPSANNLVYNQAYNNPLMNNGRISMNTSSLPVAIPLNGFSAPSVLNQPSQPGFQPTFIMN